MRENRSQQEQESTVSNSTGKACSNTLGSVVQRDLLALGKLTNGLHCFVPETIFFKVN